MTRTLGDLQAKSIGLISEPEIQNIELKPGDRFIVIASDGVWDVMSSAEVVGFIVSTNDPKESAEKLAKEARSRWEELTRTKKVIFLSKKIFKFLIFPNFLILLSFR